MTKLFRTHKVYFFPLLLLTSIIAGSITGYYMGPRAMVLKPLGDVFLNLLLVTVVPLIFFSISSAIAHIGESKKLLKLILSMFSVFIFTGIIAALFMLCIVSFFPLTQGMTHSLVMPDHVAQMNIANTIVKVITTSDFIQLLSHNNIMPLIIFSFLTGLACATTKEKGKAFSQFLHSGTEVFLKVISYIMYYAPIGFFAYFAVLISDIGPQLITSYFKIFLIYYISALIYFVLAFSLYAYIAGGKNTVKLFWGNVFIPMMTAIATCSSAASIPVNLQATKNMHVSEDIYETVIPIGAVLHKDGTVLGAIIKIAFLFGLFGMSFTGPLVLLTAIVTALLVGTVMGAIPGGGMLGEMLILSLYGFPPQSLPIIAAISLMIDPLATMLNVTGDSVAAMMIERIMKWKSTKKFVKLPVN